MRETPVSALQPAPARPLTPRVPLPKSQDSGSHLSQMSAPLFTEDRCGTSSEDETTAYDVEVTFINDRRTPSRAITVTFPPGQPISTPMTTDYTTQSDPNQGASPTPTKVQQQDNVDQYIDTNNYFVPDGSNRYIHDIQDKVFHAGYLRMETMCTYYTCQNFKICYTQANSSWMKHQVSSMLIMAILIKKCPLNLC